MVRITRPSIPRVFYHGPYISMVHCISWVDFGSLGIDCIDILHHHLPNRALLDLESLLIPLTLSLHLPHPYNSECDALSPTSPVQNPSQHVQHQHHFRSDGAG